MQIFYVPLYSLGGNIGINDYLWRLATPQKFYKKKGNITRIKTYICAHWRYNNYKNR